MQKSGIKFLNILPITIVPLDSAVIFILYAIYSTAFTDFYQPKITQKRPNRIFYCKSQKFNV